MLSELNGPVNANFSDMPGFALKRAGIWGAGVRTQIDLSLSSGQIVYE
jgi:hypothetical protein